MKTVFRRSPSTYIPSFNGNAVIQLIIASGVCFVIYWGINALMLLTGTGADFNPDIVANIALPPLHSYPAKFWTLLTYGWVHNGFWELVTNMIWLYTFGSVVQSLVGHKQVVPLYIYCLLAGGIFCLLSQLIPGIGFRGIFLITGARAALVGFAVAAYTITPQYRFFLGESIRIPIIWVAGIFLLLQVFSTAMILPLLFLLLGGGLMGFLYVWLLRSGYRPGAWIYDAYASMERLVTPNERTIWLKKSKKRSIVLKSMYEPKKGISQKRIDDILDKINQHGYNSLNAEEKDILYRASKENT